MNRQRPVAVTGAGCLCAAGGNLATCLQTLFAGHRSPAVPQRFTTAHADPYPVFEVAEELFPAAVPAEPGLSRTARLAVAAAAEALADAGWEPPQLADLRVGVAIGTTVGSAMNNEDFYRDFRDGGRPAMDPIRRFLSSNPATAVARRFNLNGPVQTVVNACSSGSDAVAVGAQWLQDGLCDLVIAGGADELCRTTCNGFISLMISSREAVRPFDRDRRGLNLGEGAGLLVLEGAALEQERPGRVRGRLAGWGGACDAYHLTAPHPEGAGLQRALREALEPLHGDRHEIAFVNAHGTGTPDNDRVEAAVLAGLLPGIPFHSTKGFTGHTLGAAGGIEAAFTLAFLQAGRIPASIGCAHPDPGLPAAPVLHETAVTGRFALSLSLAFGGNNAALLFEKGERP
jgi:3-oxoacyl-[acyl-carrier-protein] synthase-1/3-oxoacyl-[acyl-carrier-protein] synthase II